MSYNRSSGYYNSRYGGGGPPKRSAGNGSSSNNGEAGNSSLGAPPHDKNRNGMSAYGRRGDRDYYGGYGSNGSSSGNTGARASGRYDNKYNKYISGANGVPSSTDSSRNTSTYYGSASGSSSMGSGGSNFKRRPASDRYDSYTGTPKYYSSSVSSNGIEESNPKATYTKSYPSASSSKSPEWKEKDTYQGSKAYGPKINTVSVNKFSDERRSKSTSLTPTSSYSSSILSTKQEKSKKRNGTFEDTRTDHYSPPDTKQPRITTNDKHNDKHRSRQSSVTKMHNFFDDDDDELNENKNDKKHDTDDHEYDAKKSEESIEQDSKSNIDRDPRSMSPFDDSIEKALQKIESAKQPEKEPQESITKEDLKVKSPQESTAKPKLKENKTSFSDYLKSSKEKKVPYIYTPKKPEEAGNPEKTQSEVKQDSTPSDKKTEDERENQEQLSEKTSEKKSGEINSDENSDITGKHSFMKEKESEQSASKDPKENVKQSEPLSDNLKIEKAESQERPVSGNLFVPLTSTAGSDATADDETNTINQSNIEGANDISKDQNSKNKKDQNNVKSDFFSDNDSIDSEKEDEVSEAETIEADDPPTFNRTRRLVRKKDRDEKRHQLKRKAAALYTDDEEEENISKYKTTSGDDQSGDERKKKQRPYKMKRDAGGRSLLQRACKKGNIEEIKAYLEKGANPNEKDFCGFTCLHEAALEGHSEVVEILIKHGANVNAQADAAGDSETPLIDAAENKHLHTVKILLENKADPSIYNIDGFTALTKILNEHADEEGYEEIIELLEEANAKYARSKEATIKNSESPAAPVVEDPYDTYFGELIKKKGIFKFAAEGKKEVTANYFVSGNTLASKPDILIIAARNGHIELVDIILGLNPTPYNIDTENECGATALLASVGRGHFEVVESLLSKDADPRRKRKQDNLNALEIAQRSIHFDPKEVKLLEQYMNKSKSNEISKEENKEKVAKKSKEEPEAKSKEESEAKSKEEKSKEVPAKKSKEETIKKHSSPDISHSDEENSSDTSFVDSERKRKSSDDNGVVSKKLKHSNSEPKVSKVEAFERSNTPETALERTKSLERSGNSSPHNKSKKAESTPPAPLTKAQEELKAKNAEEARIWQEKVEAKKRARRGMFLKSEKEKERKRKEEEERRVEEERKLAEFREQEKVRLAKEAEEKSKVLQQKRELLMKQHTIEIYPIGLRSAKFGVKLSKEYVLQYAPLYVFEIGKAKYVTDLQVSLLTGRPVNELPRKGKRELGSVEKSKIWDLYFSMVGIDRSKPFHNLKTLRREGHGKFQNLLISFIDNDEAMAFIQNEHPATYEVISTRTTEVDLDSMNVYNGSENSRCFVSEADMDVEVNTQAISESSFVPPKLRRRQDSLRAISSATRPLW